MNDSETRISIVINTAEYLLTIDEAMRLYGELAKLFAVPPAPAPVYVLYYVPYAPNPYNPIWTPWSRSCIVRGSTITTGSTP